MREAQKGFITVISFMTCFAFTLESSFVWSEETRTTKSQTIIAETM